MKFLERFLRRSGFLVEAALARGAATSQADRFRLEEAMRQAKHRLPISPHLEETEQVLRALFGQTIDVVYRRMTLGSPAVEALLVGLNGMVDRDLAQRALSTLITDNEAVPSPGDPEVFVDWLARHRAAVPFTRVEDRLAKLVSGVLNGDTIIFCEGATRALQMATPGWEKRSIGEPESERVVVGPRDGFTESFFVNTSLLRRRIRDERFRIESLTVGEVTSTRVGVCYISGIAKQTLVDEVIRRIKRIKIDGMLDSNYLIEFIEDTPWTVFPLVHSSERPDSVTASLLEGRAAIIVDGSPFVLVVPALLNEMMQSPEDYYTRFPVVLLLRILRWFFAMLALLGPSFYVAFTTFHQEMIPTALLVSIIAAREGVPFPAVVEALGMEVAFEALREAGTRLPRPVGQTIGIVGALVIGEAAVQAGIVSAPMVIVVAMTGIASFMIPRYSGAIALRMLRFPMLILAGTFGAYGLTLGVLVMLGHLASLRSFGVPYYAPLAPWFPIGQKDVLIRAPHWAMKHRPAAVEQLDQERVPGGQAPGPPPTQGG